MIRNKTWVKDNIVLLGAAKATTHYTIGSGTKLAMEDAIVLLNAMRSTPLIPYALLRYETLRDEEVGKTQHSSDVSLQWFEEMERHWNLEPEQLAFGVMSRSKQTTYENLLLRDASFTETVQEWFLDSGRSQGFDVAPGTPPIFTPFRLRDMVVSNRVVVSPMAQYSATEGLPNDWHLVHLGSRVIGGAGLNFVEMTCPDPDARITPGCTGLWNEAKRDAWPRHKPLSVRISATDWAPGGLSGDDLVALARLFKEAGADLIDVSTGQTVPYQDPVYGRMFQTPFADRVRLEAGISTMAVGNVTTPDQVNTILLQGRADLVALARPHLTNPYFTLQASAWYQHEAQFWPNQYLSGKRQAFRLAEHERNESIETSIALRPPMHEVQEEVDKSGSSQSAGVCSPRPEPQGESS